MHGVTVRDDAIAVFHQSDGPAHPVWEGSLADLVADLQELKGYRNRGEGKCVYCGARGVKFRLRSGQMLALCPACGGHDENDSVQRVSGLQVDGAMPDDYCHDCKDTHPENACVDDVAELIRLLCDAQYEVRESRGRGAPGEMVKAEIRASCLVEKLRYQCKARYT